MGIIAVPGLGYRGPIVLCEGIVGMNMGLAFHTHLAGRCGVIGKTGDLGLLADMTDLGGQAVGKKSDLGGFGTKISQYDGSCGGLTFRYRCNDQGPEGVPWLLSSVG